MSVIVSLFATISVSPCWPDDRMQVFGLLFETGFFVHLNIYPFPGIPTSRDIYLDFFALFCAALSLPSCLCSRCCRLAGRPGSGTLRGAALPCNDAATWFNGAENAGGRAGRQARSSAVRGRGTVGVTLSAARDRC